MWCVRRCVDKHGSSCAPLLPLPPCLPQQLHRVNNKCPPLHNGTAYIPSATHTPVHTTSLANATRPETIVFCENFTREGTLNKAAIDRLSQFGIQYLIFTVKVCEDGNVSRIYTCKVERSFYVHTTICMHVLLLYQNSCVLNDVHHAHL